MMTNRNRILIALLLIVGLLGASSALAADKWLHIKVEENGDRGERVNVNIPLSVVEQMLPLIQIDELDQGRLRLDLDEFEGVDLRELAIALRDAPDADYVTVESRHESVRVTKDGEFLLVLVEEKGRHSNETVRVRMPLAVVDALVGDDPNELDLVGALRALSEFDDAPLVDVESDDATIRIWIDSNQSS